MGQNDAALSQHVDNFSRAFSISDVFQSGGVAYGLRRGNSSDKIVADQITRRVML